MQPVCLLSSPLDPDGTRDIVAGPWCPIQSCFHESHVHAQRVSLGDTLRPADTSPASQHNSCRKDVERGGLCAPIWDGRGRGVGRGGSGR